jgi:pimeloyl-ACP methyl ester carboxylesterase
MEPAVKSIELSTGVTLPYVEQGELSGAAVLLLHGVTDSWRSFQLALPHLPPEIRAFALTQRGHGDADRPKTGYRTQDFASDVAAFVAAQQLGPIVIVGHSMGSTNALRFAVDHPELTLGLVLVAAFSGYRHNSVVVDFWESAVSRLTDPVDPGFVREFQEGTLAQPVPEPFLETVVLESLKVPSRVWRATFEGFMDDSAFDDLERITSPTLILWGAHDAFCSRRDQESLLGSIPASQLIVYENAGHALHWEEPRRFAADVAAFAEKLRA